jgi:hypothetical protein
VGFSTGASARTVGEAQPFVSPGSLRRFGVSISERIAVECGLTFFTGLGGQLAVLLVVSAIIGVQHFSHHMMQMSSSSSFGQRLLQQWHLHKSDSISILLLLLLCSTGICSVNYSDISTSSACLYR